MGRDDLPRERPKRRFVVDRHEAMALDQLRRSRGILNHQLEELLRDLPRDCSLPDHPDHVAETVGSDRELLDREPVLVPDGVDLGHDPVRGELGLPRSRHDLLVVGGERSGVGEHLRVVFGNLLLAHQALPELVRELWNSPADRLDPLPRQIEREQVGLREVPVVMRLLLAAHRLGDAALRAPEERFLHDAPAGLE